MIFKVFNDPDTLLYLYPPPLPVYLSTPHHSLLPLIDWVCSATQVIVRDYSRLEHSPCPSAK
jgi:hypothetical protein